MIKYFLSFLLLFTASLAFTPSIHAQPGMMPMMHDAPAPVKHGPYKDSVQFKEDFKELYPFIRPTPNVKERAQTMIGKMAPMLKSRGIDSVKAYDTAMKALDLSIDEKLLFDAYRAEFSADELKPLATFFKTPVGKHYLEVEAHLVAARSTAIDQYIAGTIYHSVMPMMKPGGGPGMQPHPGMGQPPIPGQNPNHAPMHPTVRTPGDTTRMAPGMKQ
jgi:Uncharacterized protein conserved in bacteria (DUF2059)